MMSQDNERLIEMGQSTDHVTSLQIEHLMSSSRTWISNKETPSPFFELLSEKEREGLSRGWIRQVLFPNTAGSRRRSGQEREAIFEQLQILLSAESRVPGITTISKCRCILAFAWAVTDRYVVKLEKELSGRATHETSDLTETTCTASDVVATSNVRDDLDSSITDNPGEPTGWKKVLANIAKAATPFSKKKKKRGRGRHDADYQNTTTSDQMSTLLPANFEGVGFGQGSEGNRDLAAATDRRNEHFEWHSKGAVTRTLFQENDIRHQPLFQSPSNFPAKKNRSSSTPPAISQGSMEDLTKRFEKSLSVQRNPAQRGGYDLMDSNTRDALDSFMDVSYASDITSAREPSASLFVDDTSISNSIESNIEDQSNPRLPTNNESLVRFDETRPYGENPQKEPTVQPLSSVAKTISQTRCPRAIQALSTRVATKMKRYGAEDDLCDEVSKWIQLTFSIVGSVCKGDEYLNMSEAELFKLFLADNQCVHTVGVCAKNKANAERWTELMKKTKGEKCTMPDECGRLIAAGFACTPGLSFCNGEHLIATVRTSLLAELGIPCSLEQASKKSPSANTLKSYLADLGAALLTHSKRKLLKARYIFIGVDKGKRDGIDHFVKLICYWDDQDSKTDYFLLDMDAVGGSDDDAAEAILFAMQQKGLGDLKLHGHCTDNGGAGVLERLYEVLKDRGLTDEEVFYFVANCTLHNLQLVMAPAMEQVYGLGAIDKNNHLQLLHNVYDLQNFFDFDVWIEIFMDAVEEETGSRLGMAAPKKMQEPITTRWWRLGTACTYVIQYWRVLKIVCQRIINSFGSESYATTVASSLSSMLREEELYGNILFTKCFHDFIMTPHFDFFQERGDRSKVASFGSNNVLVRYFLLSVDLDLIREDKWKDHESFKPYSYHLYHQQRWPTAAEDAEMEDVEAFLQKYSPANVMKDHSKSSKLKSSIEKKLKLMEKEFNAIEKHQRNLPRQFCDMSLAKGDVLTAFCKLFDVDTKLSANQKRDALGGLDIHPEHITIGLEKLQKEINTLSSQRKAIDLGISELILKCFAVAVEYEIESYWDPDGLYALVAAKMFSLLAGNNEDDDRSTQWTKDELDSAVDKLEELVQSLKQDCASETSEQLARDEIERAEQYRNDSEVGDTEEVPNDEDDCLAVEDAANELGAPREDQPAQSRTPNQEVECQGMTYERRAERNTNIFLEISHSKLHEHFGRWANQLLMFGVASERPTAQAVAQFISSRPFAPTTQGDKEDFDGESNFQSPVHGRTINLTDFFQFLEQKCSEESRMEIQETQYFQEHREGVGALAEGEDIWESVVPAAQELKRWCQDVVLAIPSNNQFVEQTVREGMLVGTSNRSESTRSLFAIVRSFLLKATRQRTEKESKIRILKANQHTTSGGVGERTMKMKTQEEDRNSWVRVRGRFKSEKLMEATQSLTELSTPEEIEAAGHLKTILLSSREETFRAKRKEKTLQNYKEKSRKQRKKNKKQARRPILRTPLSRGCIKFSQLTRTDFIADVQCELDERGIPYRAKLKIKDLVKLLKSAVKRQDGLDENGAAYEDFFHPRSTDLKEAFPNSLHFWEV